MGLDAVVYKRLSVLESEFPGHRFQRDPETGECEAIHSQGPRIPWDAGMACNCRLGNVSHIGELHNLLAERLGPGSALERLVLYSGSHSGDVIDQSSFEALEAELRLVESDLDFREFAEAMLMLIRTARQEQNPIVFE